MLFRSGTQFEWAAVLHVWNAFPEKNANTVFEIVVAGGFVDHRGVVVALAGIVATGIAFHIDAAASKKGCFYGFCRLELVYIIFVEPSSKDVPAIDPFHETIREHIFGAVPGAFHYFKIPVAAADDVVVVDIFELATDFFF